LLPFVNQNIEIMAYSLFEKHALYTRYYKKA